MKRAWLVLALLLGGGIAVAQPMPEGEPQPGKPVRDSDFGVSTRQFGLERQVEMYQWRARRRRITGGLERRAHRFVAVRAGP